MPDPAKVQGDETAIVAAFADTLAMLRRLIRALMKQFEAEPGIDAVQLLKYSEV
jgi:arsenate reductase